MFNRLFLKIASCIGLIFAPNASFPFIIIDIPLKSSLVQKKPATAFQRQCAKFVVSQSVQTILNPTESNVTVSPVSNYSKFNQERKKQTWNPVSSLGSLFLQRSKIENFNSSKIGEDWTNQPSGKVDSLPRTHVNIGRVEIIDETKPRKDDRWISSQNYSTFKSIPGMIFNIDPNAIITELSNFKSDIDKVSSCPRRI